MSTVQQVLDRLRVRLDETTARKWSDGAQLIPYIADAEQWLADLLGRMRGSGRYRYRDTFTLSANTETYALSSLTKRLAEVLEVQVQIGNLWAPCTSLRDGEDAVARNVGLGASGLVVPSYVLFGEDLKFLPKSSVAQPMAILYRYWPSIKTLAADVLETPAQYNLDLVNRALHFALADSGQGNVKFEEEYAARIAEIEALESRRTYGANTETVRRKSSRGLFSPR